MTSDIAFRLRDALVGAYRAHVESVLADRGLPSVDDAVDEGERWLTEELTDLLARPFREQSRAPFEMFQEAMQFPTEALKSRGVPPVERDPVAVAALPGDHYGLAPASSSELSEDVWRAHIEWGAAKAAAFRPTLIVVSSNILDQDRIDHAARRAGYEVVAADRPAAFAYVDLEHARADESIASLASRGVRVIAFGPHVDDIAMTRARTLGAVEAVPRSRFFRDPAAWLQPLV